MLLANTKRALLTLTATAFLFLAGCAGPDEKVAKGIDEATQLLETGSIELALQKLELLNKRFPNDPRIMWALADAYGQSGDPLTAAIFFEQVYQLDPENSDLMLAAYQAHQAAGNPVEANAFLELLAASAPERMSADLWIQLGRSRTLETRIQPALEAYLSAMERIDGDPDPATAVEIGALFMKADNIPQAERYYNSAIAGSEQPSMPALFGLLEIHVRKRDWKAADSVIQTLDKEYPGALDASQWADARLELDNWKKAQAQMKAELAQARAAQETAGSGQEVALEPEDSAPVDAESKEIANAEFEAAQALASNLAVEVEGVPVEVAGVDGPARTQEPDASATYYDPNIAIEPAEPDVGFDVSFEQGAGAVAVEPATPEYTTPTGPSTQTLAEKANQAVLDGDYESAIRDYWMALGQNNTRADLWNELSKAYMLNGQLKNAETTALESIRLAPRDVGYTLDYLRIAQRTKSADDFVAELETAYDRFPRSSDLALSLARAYERVAGNNENARDLYRTFLELAPNHPLRPEAEEALRRLR